MTDQKMTIDVTLPPPAPYISRVPTTFELALDQRYKLERIARRQQITMAQVLRALVEALPDVPDAPPVKLKAMPIRNPKSKRQAVRARDNAETLKEMKSPAKG